jgi:threonine dehydratase
MQTTPCIKDMYAARPHVYQYMSASPLLNHAGISNLLGTQTWIKHENHNPTGAFKVRGGLNLAATLSDAERTAGLFSASTGNHGQSIAFAAMKHGVKATIAVPEGANPGKVKSMQNLGAKVLFHGSDFDTSRTWVQELAQKQGGRFVSPTEPALMAGVGTYALEIVENLPDVEIIIVPVGAGSGVCATAIVAKTLNPDIQVIGVQSRQAPAMQLSWQNREMLEAEMHTTAEGLATRVPFENTQTIMRDLLDDFILVDDAQIDEATLLLMQNTHNLVEGAGAASMAAAMSLMPEIKGHKTVLVMSGGNQSLEKLKALL